ncbi:MAG TPA: asparagine synthase (glutamine-hydrolyzing) [Terriglobales bacterium]|nr:asparagine synthase (glutamine-hydrolyzing) [Terriglobales bacterium]
MCGIAGIVGARGDVGIDQFTIQAMCRTIIHRGPDDEGIFVKDGVGLGSRRLSVIDLGGGHQPVFNEDGSVWVVFNGEIYNFPELRRELEARGHAFYTNSDTEVLVHLYEDLGVDCVHKLRGMFAFALFDEKRRKLLLARDRLGKKPLHYALVGNRLFFGSEIKAILCAAPELATVNSRAILPYFYFGYIPDPETAFTEIHKLPPGYLLEYENGNIRIRQYWDFPQYASHCPASEEECLAELETRLAEAVRIRLLADVPVGALLSGGVDSSTIVALMARASHKPVKTFSIGFRFADFDETPYAREVARAFATDHHELILDPDVVSTVQSLGQSLEEPFGDSSMLPTYMVSCLARKHVTVALSGDGGDEAFAGYERYRIHLRDRAYPWIPAWVGRIYRKYVYPRLPFGVPGRNFAYSLSLPWSERYLEGVSLVPEQRNCVLLNEDFVSASQDHSDPLNLFRCYIQQAPADDPLSQILYLDSKTYLPGDILTKVDRMSMAASLEVRAPMLDHVFLEWVAGLGPEWKMGSKRQKYILTKLARRVGVPPSVLDRPKQGFTMPLVHWMRNELKDLMYSLLLDRRTLERGFFNEQGVRRMLTEFLAGNAHDHLPIWRLMMFELWQRNFVEAFGRRHSMSMDCVA